jgi:peptide/nickel transport system ATP-binding protein
MAIALEPELIIADEPTTALDVIMQAQIVNLLRRLSDERDIALLVITHNVALVAEICQEVAVMYAGRIVEYGAGEEVFGKPHHPYTIGLTAAFPSILELEKPLVSIPGSPPVLQSQIFGCPFGPRCPFFVKLCSEKMPALIEIGINHSIACHRYEEAFSSKSSVISFFSKDHGNNLNDKS